MQRTLPLVLVALGAFAPAQVVQTWSATHDGVGQTELLYDAALDTSGRLAITGRSFNVTSGFPPPPPTADIETVVYDAAGTLLWSRRFDGPLAGEDVGYAVAFDPSGNVIVAGQSSGYSGAAYVSQRTVLKYDAAGTLLWATHTGNLAGPNVARALEVDAGGAITIAGADGGAGDGDLCVARLDASGNELWVARANGSANAYDHAYDVAPGPGGDTWACGYLVQTGAGQDIALVRVDASGNVVWTRTYGGTANTNDAGFSLAVDALGTAYVGGFDVGTLYGQDARVLKYDAAGALQWTATFTQAGSDVVRKVALDPFGRLVVGATLTHATTGRTFLRTLAYSPAGAVLWEADRIAPTDLVQRGLCVDAQGNSTVAGYGTDLAAPGTGQDAIAVGYDSTGRERFVHVLSNGSAAGTTQTVIDAESWGIGSAALAGYGDPGLGTQTDFLAARLDRTARGFCFGDGSAAACPCGNASAPGAQEGCVSSLSVAARLVDRGQSSLASDTLVLEGAQMPSSSALYFQGTTQQSGGAGVAFGDGLRCAGGTVVRLATKLNDATGRSEYPGVGYPSVSTRGLVTAPGQRTYQIWYRNAAAFCTPATFNLSNGLLVDWTS